MFFQRFKTSHVFSDMFLKAVSPPSTLKRKEKSRIFGVDIDFFDVFHFVSFSLWTHYNICLELVVGSMDLGHSYS